MNKTKQATYDFIIKELSHTLDGHDGVTLQDMLVHCFDTWFDGPGNKRKHFTEFVREYVYSYPIIPFETYDITSFLKNINMLTENDTVETYVQLVAAVIYDLLNGKQAQYEA